MTRAVLSLGSNLGDRTEHLRVAVDGLGSALRSVSGVYRTPPWGGVPQDDFHNIVVLVDDADTDATGWLARCQALESAAGRERTIRWGPRTLDADVVTVTTDDGEPVLSDDPELTLPHPRAAERAFVLLPWADVDPAATLPGAGPIAALLDGLDVSGISRIGDLAPGAGDR
jgi:2-amino-4-hydroxy-6-hydroxymethyldihydropteridine diphosphokinase